MKTAFKVLSFDLDNALYDNAPVIAHAENCSSEYLQAAFEKQGQTFDFETFLTIRQSLIKQNNPEFENLSRMRRLALSILCRDLDNANSIAEEAFNRFIEARSLIKVEPEIDAMLAKLSGHYIIVSASNGNCDIASTELGEYFDTRWSASDDFRAKPHPQMLQAICQHYSIDSRDLLHIGDSEEKDGGCARAAGAEYFKLAPFENGYFDPEKVFELENRLLNLSKLDCSTKSPN